MQYECDDVFDGFWGPEDGCRSNTGSETVPGQIFTSINFRGLGFIREYSENKYVYGMLYCQQYRYIYMYTLYFCHCST